MALLAGISITHSQTQVPTGSGSYASTVPTTHLADDGYYAPTPQTMINEYATLFISPSLKTKPIPTNHWWTDLLIGQRQNNGTWLQQQFDGNGNAGQLWAYPGVVQPAQTGKTLFFPNSWIPNTSTPPALAQGAFYLGPNVFVENYTGIHIGGTDSALGDFTGTAYPAGWTPSGGLVDTAPIQGGTWPGESPAVTGLLGSACLNTYRGTNATTGTLTSPTFTIKDTYIDLKVGGGNDPSNTCIQLLVGGKVVETATGQQDATLRWTQWNVSAFMGQTAQLVVRDTSTGSWGFILCNYIVATNNSANPATLYTSAMTASKAIISAYSDWAIDYTESNSNGSQVTTTVARGIPFVWDQISGVSPRIHLGTGTALYNASGSRIATNSGTFSASCFAFTLSDSYGGSHTFGVFAPTNTTFIVSGDYVEVVNPKFLVYGFLPAVSNLSEFSQYAYARPTNTVFNWTLNSGPKTSSSPGGSVDTTWTVTTSPLQGTASQTLQGWLPHHYRTTSNKLAFKNYTYLTPRGVMQMAPGSSFAISWPFRGISPVLPAPHTNNLANDYNASRMQSYLQNFAAVHPSAGADTYWQGKEFGISAQYMTQAAQLGASGPFFSLQSSLHQQLEDWLTYTPGKPKNFFAQYPNWGAIIGFNSSYGTVGFNDNHFHYGYFTVASALLACQDSAFMNQYGPMVELLAKEYNNWDRTDNRFPFMRVFDVWEGHNNAGGLSSPGGENQESSSESMNSWVGMFLSGNLMGNAAMASAGAMGYAVESSAVNEYYQDWEEQNFPAGYGKGMCGILGAGGIGYGTYFSGDPAWIYAIQMTPANHWNNYLVRNKTFAEHQFSSIWTERTAASNYDKLYNPGGFILADKNDPEALGAYPGDYVLAFQAMFDPNTTANLFDAYWAANDPIATDATYPGSVYYLTHTLRALGDQDLTSYTSIPTSQVYITAAGKRTYVIYNPAVTAQVATVYTNGIAIGKVEVPAHSLVSATGFGGSATNTPYYGIAAPLPSTLQFANYDFGGPNVSYHAGTTNTGGQYRPSEGVDIVASTNGSYDVVALSGQWFDYTVNIGKSGSYTALFTLGASKSASMHIVDETNKNVSGAISIPATGGQQKYEIVQQSLTLSAGIHTLRVVIDSGTVNLNQVAIYGIGASANIPVGDTISMKSVGDTFYVSADNAGLNPLIANRPSASGWEEYQIVDEGNGYVALLAQADSKYVSLDTATGNLIANSTSVGAQQSFEWIDEGNGIFALLCKANGRYVTVPGSTTPLTVTASSIGPNESFAVTIVPS